MFSSITFFKRDRVEAKVWSSPPDAGDPDPTTVLYLSADGNGHIVHVTIHAKTPDGLLDFLEECKAVVKAHQHSEMAKALEAEAKQDLAEAARYFGKPLTTNHEEALPVVQDDVPSELNDANATRHYKLPANPVSHTEPVFSKPWSEILKEIDDERR